MHNLALCFVVQSHYVRIIIVVVFIILWFSVIFILICVRLFAHIHSLSICVMALKFEMDGINFDGTLFIK